MLCSPAGVAVDDSGRVYVADPPHGRIVRFTNGTPSQGHVFDCEVGEGLAWPAGLALSAGGETLYATDMRSGTVQKYATRRLARVVVHVYDPADHLHPRLDDFTFGKPNSDDDWTVYEYDENGNRTQKQSPGIATWTYEYDTSDRLVRAVEQPGLGDPVEIFRATYDYRTRRLTKTELAGSEAETTSFRYDGGVSFQEWKDGNKQVEFVRGSGMGGGIGSILYSDRTAVGGGKEYFVYNAVGHTVATVTGDDPAGEIAVESTNLYEAFGNIVSSSGTSGNNRLANTKERDSSINLDNHGFRYYDREIGRYVTRDPAGLEYGMNAYLHVFNNPVNHLDPLGLGIDDVVKLLRRLARKFSRGKTDDAIRIGGRRLRNYQFAGARVSLKGRLRKKYPRGVRFTTEGFVDLAEYAEATVKVSGLTGDAAKDARRAVKAADKAGIALPKNFDDFVWHHTEDLETMQLVPKDIHEAVGHTGGAAIRRQLDLGKLALVFVAPESMEISERLKRGEQVKVEEAIRGMLKDIAEIPDPGIIMVTEEVAGTGAEAIDAALGTHTREATMRKRINIERPDLLFDKMEKEEETPTPASLYREMFD